MKINKIQLWAWGAFCLLLIACGGAGDQKPDLSNQQIEQLVDSIPESENRPRPIPPTPYSDLMKSKTFSGKVASPEDVAQKGAIFSFNPPEGTEQAALPLKMPLMVFWDRHPNQDTILFVVQCERLGADTMVGWVNGWGKSGMAPLRELIHAQEQRRIDQRDFRKPSP
ncbi:MAG: hypothetical protein O3C32_02750 [Bacteroidetes bacterium]|nr:hypothetical protein [Bacteroidota bacterium]